MIYIYRIILNIIIIFAPIIILIRIFKKKEHPLRFLEKFTFFSKQRRKGKLIWFHAVSVGELKSIIPLLRKLDRNMNISQILVTSSTLSSSELFKSLKFRKTIHQFFPIDNNLLTKRFLNYWSPNLAIFVDSEIWPNMLKNLKQKSINRILINARISKKSYFKWIKLGSFSKNLFQTFNYCYPQNFESKKHLKKLGVQNIKYLGNLKFIQNELMKEKLGKNLNYFLKSKKVWCAVSTHPGEEIICAKIHQLLCQKYKNLLLIIIPRHTFRIEGIRKELIDLKMITHIHSQKRKIHKDTNVYLVDSYGETEKFFEVCKIVFMGKSLTADGGQNPLEAARENCFILHGPKVSNFRDIYKYLDEQKISFKIKSYNQFLKMILFLLKNKNNPLNVRNKLKLIGHKILKNNIKEINSLIK